MPAEIRQIHVDEKSAGYIVQLIHATRNHQDIALAAVRGPPSPCIGARSRSRRTGDLICDPGRCETDCARLLGHRLISAREPPAQRTVADAIKEILDKVPVPAHAGAGLRRMKWILGTHRAGC